MQALYFLRSKLCPFLILIPITAAQFACSNTPEIKADYVGIDHLKNAQSAGEKYPSASTLPMVSPGGSHPSYRLGPLDQLIISVYGRDDLGSQIPIDANSNIRTSKVQEDGDIVLPLIGSISVAGKTLDDAYDEIASRHEQRLDISYVDVQIHSCHSQPVNITGAVNEPGLYYLCDTMNTLGDLLSAAHGLSTDAYTAGGILKRDGKTYRLDHPLKQEIDLYMDVLLQAGDSVFFPRITEGTEPVVFIFGEVNKQGAYVIPPQGMTLLEALGKASGAISETASSKSVYFMRNEPGSENAITYEITLAELYDGPAIQLEDGDRIFVAPSGMTQWDRWWRQAIPFMSIRGPQL